MWKTSMSITIGSLLAYGEWEVLTIFCKFLGPAEVAVWGILGTLWDVLENVTESVGDACEVRVAMLLGAGQPELARISCYKSMYLGFFVALVLSCFLFMLGDDIPTWFTSDQKLQNMLSELIPLFGVGNIGLTIGSIAWTAVGAQGRYRLATAIGYGGSWFVTMPLAILSTLVIGFDLQGQTSALVLGYMVSGAVLTFLIFTSDWAQLSKQVIEANDGIIEDDDDSSIEASSEDTGPKEAVEVATRDTTPDIDEFPVHVIHSGAMAYNGCSPSLAIARTSTPADIICGATKCI